MSAVLSHAFPPEVVQRATRITTLVVDVDGVLTDGRIIYDEWGDELKHFDVQDGAGLVFWRRAGMPEAMNTAVNNSL
jgi:3-deoxy-D-manno-octulosonate 8-phosphate phosphatase (KDO 8-P phosphatase)